MAGTGGLSPAAEALAAVALEHVPEGSTVVALSGGADSAVCAWLVDRAGLGPVTAVHVNHDLDASAELEEAARNIAGSLGIPLRTVSVTVPDGASFEDRARQVRLEALEAEASDADWIATGHHADDSAETVLGNLVRGAGATGLSGIARRRGKWVRPLLGVGRAEVRAAAEGLGLPFMDDPANTDPRHRRNIVRSEVLPWLEERLGVPISTVLARSASLVAADDAELERSVAAIPIFAHHGGTAAPAVVVATLPEVLAARLARRLLRRAHPPYPGNRADVQAILGVASGVVERASLTGGMLAAREGPLVVVYEDRPRPLDPAHLELGVPVAWGDLRVKMSADAGVPTLIGRDRVRGVAAAFDGECIVRSAMEGERIELPAGSKPVREVMREGGVPTRLRPAWPIIAVGGKIAWVAGVRLAAWALPEGEGPFVVLSIEGTGG